MRKLFYNHTYSPRAVTMKRFEEKNTEPSQTVQGEITSISDLLKREIQGMPIGRRPVQYMEVEDINSIHEFYRPIVDLTDYQELKRHHEALEEQLTQFEAYKAEQDAKDPNQMAIFNEPKKEEQKDSPKTEE